MLLVLAGWLCLLVGTVPTLPIHQIALHGNTSLGYYYLELYVGTPPQKTALVIDTGSGVTALPCEPCSHCGSGHLNPRFRISASNSSRYLTCVQTIVM